MRITPVCLLLVLLVGNTYAQKRTRAQQKPSAGTVTTQTARTTDGRTVLLKSDGTWEFATDSAVTQSIAAPVPESRTTSIEVEAALVYRSGDVRPVARTQLFLLDENLVTILRAAGLKTVGIVASRGDTDDNLLFTFGLAMKYPSNNDYLAFYPAAAEALKKHVKHQATTDFTGRVTFENVKAGSYFIYGMSETPRGFVLWNLPVEVKSEKVKLILDQNNAAHAS